MLAEGWAILCLGHIRHAEDTAQQAVAITPTHFLHSQTLSHAVEEDSAGRLATETAVSTRALTTQTLVESPFPLAVSTCAQVPINCSRELTLEGP